MDHYNPYKLPLLIITAVGSFPFCIFFFTYFCATSKHTTNEIKNSLKMSKGYSYFLFFRYFCTFWQGVQPKGCNRHARQTSCEQMHLFSLKWDLKGTKHCNFLKKSIFLHISKDIHISKILPESFIDKISKSANQPRKLDGREDPRLDTVAAPSCTDSAL